MTRIDAFSPQERESIKKEIKQEIRREDRRRRLVAGGGCALAVLIAVAIPTLYVAAQLAKTGFFDVPVFSRSLYKPSDPERVVLPLAGSKPEDVYRILGTKVRYDPQTALATFPVTETELTTIVGHAVAVAPPDTLPFPIKTIQIAIDPQRVEIYAISPQKNRDATVRIRFRPYVKGGELRNEVIEIQIGSLVLPKKIGELLFAAFGALVTDSVKTATANVGSLVNIETDKGIARFIISPAVRP